MGLEIEDEEEDEKEKFKEEEEKEKLVAVVGRGLPNGSTRLATSDSFSSVERSYF